MQPCLKKEKRRGERREGTGKGNERKRGEEKRGEKRRGEGRGGRICVTSPLTMSGSDWMRSLSGTMEQWHLHLRCLESSSTRTSAQDFCFFATWISFILTRKQRIPTSQRVRRTEHCVAPAYSTTTQWRPFLTKLGANVWISKMLPSGASCPLILLLPEICPSAVPPRGFPGALKTHYCA